MINILSKIGKNSLLAFNNKINSKVKNKVLINYVNLIKKKSY